MHKLFKILSFAAIFILFGIYEMSPIQAVVSISIGLYLIGIRWWRKFTSLQYVGIIYAVGWILTIFYIWFSLIGLAWPLLGFLGTMCFLYILDNTIKGDLM